MENIKFWGNMYLSPWETDNERYKKHWWHNTLFAYKPLTYNEIKYFRYEKPNFII